MPGRKPLTRKPAVLFCDLRRPSDEIINISSQNGAEGVVTQMLPKSHISHVILNANVSEERFLDMKVSSENRMQKKSRDVHDHFINTFLKRLERKQNRWMKEDNYVYKNFNITSSPRRPVSVDFSDGYPEHLLATPQSVAVYHPAKYPYSTISRKTALPAESASQKQVQRRSQTAMNTSVSLPRIASSKRPNESTVPAAKDGSSEETNGVKLPKTSNGFFHSKTQWDNDGTSHYPGRMISEDWQSRATTTRRSKRKVTFRFEDDRFESLMLYLSPVIDKQSLRGGRDIFSRINSPMSKQSARMLAHRS